MTITRCPYSQQLHDVNTYVSSLLTGVQERFTKVISQNADLTDKLQEYEHITIQLEGENSTIAEYIDLYHKRRRDLKEKFMEKDAFISKLLQEKEALKVKSNPWVWGCGVTWCTTSDHLVDHLHGVSPGRPPSV